MEMDAFFKVVKGAPLTVLLAMCSRGGQASLQELCKITGYTHKTVQRALEVLMSIEMVTRTHYHEGWLLTSGGVQPPLFFANQLNKGKNFPTAAVKLIENKKIILNENTEAVDGKISLILEEAGIGRPMRDWLASDPEITAEYAEAIIEDGKANGQSVGLIIHRLKTHDPLTERPHPKNCDCMDCRYSKYAGWEGVNH